MRKLLAALSITLSAAVLVAPPVWAEPGIERAGAVEIPEGPAQAWLLADLGTGRILASPPAWILGVPSHSLAQESTNCLQLKPVLPSYRR